MNLYRIGRGCLGLWSAILVAVPSYGQVTLGPCMYLPTSISGVMKGKALINGVAAEAGDIVSAWDERGHCAGAATVTLDGGQAGINLPIYGDDPVSAQLDEGMNADERFYLRLLDVSTGQEWLYNAPLSGWSSQGGATMPIYSNTAVPFNATVPIHEVSLRVMLQGPYDDAVHGMKTGLVTQGAFPLSQPYGTSIWEYRGVERIASAPSSAVDWVLVRLVRADPAKPAMQLLVSRAAVLHSDGSIRDPAGGGALRLAVHPGSYRVAVLHRNHMSVMSSVEIPFTGGPVNYDFTTGMGQAYGQNAMAELEPGVFGMIAGDANGVNGVTASDNAIWVQQNGTDGYKAGDFNLNGQITAADAALWTKNNGKGAQTPTHAFSGVYVNSIGVRLSRIPSGTFQMGSTADTPDEKPVHSVTLTHDFLIGLQEVTQKQWIALRGSYTGAHKDCPGEVDDDCPASGVSWMDAIGFANSISVAEGLTPCYDGSGNVTGGAGGNVYLCQGYRLPTEAEWEYFTRAGTTTEYSNGENLPPSILALYGWHWWNTTDSKSRPVGRLLPNPWGLYDVHGNVWEAANDWYGEFYYASSPSTDPLGPAPGGYVINRVIRGGCYIDDTLFLRSAHRFDTYPSDKYSNVGLRLARTVL